MILAADGPTGLELRREAGRLTAALTRALGPRRLDLAEDAVQEAMARALRVWPVSGTPDDPTAWLLTVARNVARDRLRRDRRRSSLEDGDAETTAALAELEAGDGGPGSPTGRLADEELAMVFMACHPALSLPSRVALTLKTVCGLTVPEIARALLAKPSAVAQRLSRAKATLREAGARFEVPGGDELHERLDAVAEVLYLLFNEGYAAAGGDELIREDLAAEALRLAQELESALESALSNGVSVRETARERSRVTALVALFRLQAARLPARVSMDDEGRPVAVPLAEQDRSRWDPALLAGGFRALERAREAAAGGPPSSLHLQAALAAAHVAPEPDWPAIAALHDHLVEIDPSPIHRLNRLVARVRAGTETLADARAEADDLRRHSALADYHLTHAVAADLATRAGDAEAAARALDHALACPCSEPERRLLERRRRALLLP